MILVRFFIVLMRISGYLQIGDNMKGKIKFFNEDKQYGFIIGEDDREYFFHKNDLHPNTDSVKENDYVKFSDSKNDKGLKAFNILHNE